jgi:hypothetical protein
VVEVDEDDNPIPRDEHDKPTILEKAGFQGDAASNDDVCPRCRRVDSIVYQSQGIRGASAALQMIGICEKCGAQVPGPRRQQELREVQALPRNDFGRRRW